MADLLAFFGFATSLLLGLMYYRAQQTIRKQSQDYQILLQEQQQVEQQFDNKEQLFSLIYDQSSELMGLVSIEEGGRYIIVSLNQAYTKALLHYGIDISSEAFTGLPLEYFCRKVLHNSEGAINQVKKRYQKVQETKSVVQYEASSELANGQKIVMEIILSPVIDDHGNCTHIIDLARDITQRKQAEESLKKANRRLSTLISNLPGVVYRCDTGEAWTVEYLSSGFAELTGYSPRDFYGENSPKTWRSLVHEEDISRTSIAIDEAFADKQPYQIIYRIINAHGKLRWIWEQGREVHDEQGGVMWREGFMLDISDLKSAQERLVGALKERQRFIRQHNKMLENKVHERTQALEQQSQELSKLNKQLQKKNKALEFSEEELRQNGEELHASNEFLTEAQKVLDKKNKDLQEALKRLKETQAQLVQSEKMATLGQLTAGIAHEINNPVNYIYSGIEGLKIVIDDLLEVLNAYESINVGSVEEDLEAIAELKLSLEYTEVLDGAQELIKNIANGASRTAEIVRELRTFARLDETGLKYIDLHENIDSTLVLLHGQYDKRIEIQKYYGDLPRIECYPGKLNQVFMNILVNAIQAIEKTGAIEIHTSISREDAKGQSITITIKDNGIGIPLEIQSKIFEPFFTNKDVGEGTGLGLSISLSIIKLHQGEITCCSEVGKGTIFTISLPVTQAT